MKRNMLFITVGLSVLLATSASAGENEHTALMQSKLAQDSSPANVKAVTLQQKTLNCEQNAKNQRLQGTEKASYVTSCINKNDALEHFSKNNRGMASTYGKNTLQQSPAIEEAERD